MSISPNKILLAKSPQFITYSGSNNYTHLKILLYLWRGEIADVPYSPSYTYTVYRTSPNSNCTYLDIQQPIADFLSPAPNESYFTATPSDFGEIVNVRYFVDVYRKETDGTLEYKETIDSKNMLATLGYGRHFEGSNPKLKIIPSSDVTTVDSSLITIDSTLYTIDEYGEKILFQNKYKFHAPNAHVFDAFLNEDAEFTADIVKRELANDYKVSCTGKYSPKQVMYMNKNGLFETFSFTRASSESVKSTIEVSNRLNPTPYNYNSADHNQKVTKTGTKKYTFNTDNINEKSGEYLKDLFFSDVYYLVDFENKTIIPLILTDTDFIPKTDMNDRGKQQYKFSFQELNEYVQKIR